MKKFFCLFVFVPLMALLSCSSDEFDVRFDDFTLEVADGEIQSPRWLKDLIDSQMGNGGKNRVFLGEVRGFEYLDTKYILVTNHISSNSCLSVQLFYLDGEPITCGSELYQELASLRPYPSKLLWNGMDPKVKQ